MDFVNSKDNEYFIGKVFVGIVEENKDPKRIGRIKVRVQSVFDTIELEHIPWAHAYRTSDGRNFSIPAIGKIVNILFFDGDIYQPQYIYSENCNVNLQNKLKELGDDEYSNFVALLFDNRTQVYADDSALTLDYFDNAIRIKKNDIDIKLKDNTQQLHLGHSDCNQSAVLGDNFFQWLHEFLVLFQKSDSLMGNFATPVLKQQLELKITEYLALEHTFLSKHVKIVDNCKISSDDYDNNRINISVKDDKTKINNEQILQPKTNNPEAQPITNSQKENSQKEELKKKVEEERKKDTAEQIQTEPDTTTTEPKTLDDYDTEETNWEYEDRMDEELNKDPYEGLWDNYVPRGSNQEERKVITNTENYGSYESSSETESSGIAEFSNIKTVVPIGAVATTSVIIPTNSALSKIPEVKRLSKQSDGTSLSDIRDVTLEKKIPKTKPKQSYNPKQYHPTISANTIVKNMNEFIQDVLSPLADFLKTKYPTLYQNLKFNSGNRSVAPSGGSETSQHFYGQAIDITINTNAQKTTLNENLKLLNAILDWYKTNPVGYDQILFETNEKSSWIHMSYRRTSKPKLELARMKNHNDKSKNGYFTPIAQGKYTVSVDFNTMILSDVNFNA